MHRVGYLAMALVAGLGTLPSCRYGFDSHETLCQAIDCSGHGRCEVDDRGWPGCVCDPGYLNLGPESCVPDPSVVCRVDADCDDQNPCTRDTCLLEKGCLQDTVQGPCDDGSPCTQEDRCLDGTCLGVPRDQDGDGYADEDCGGLDCDDADGSVHPGRYEGLGDDAMCGDGRDNDCDGLVDTDDPGCQPCTGDGDCDDLNACNGTERCLGGLCDPGEPLDCGDLVECTRDSCDPQAGCSNLPDDALCDDGNACTLDTCETNAGCHNMPDLARCDDQNPCTDDQCAPESGACSHGFNEAPCDDSLFCTWPDRCFQGECAGGETSPCPDGLLCDEAQDACEQQGCTGPEDCDDLLDCTLDDCVAGVCHHVALDEDGDGYPPMTAKYCVGSDCDDANPAVHPDAQEGGYLSPTCFDGIDNDCDGLTDTDAACLPGSGLFGAGSFQLEHPGHDHRGLRSVRAFAVDDVWAVGMGGLALHFDGTGWQRFFMQDDADLEAVHGSAPDDLWFATRVGGEVRRWNGADWTVHVVDAEMIEPSLFVLGPDQAWLVGDEDRVYRFNADGWEANPTGTGAFWDDVWATGPDDVWVAGDSLVWAGNSILAHWNGAEWTPHTIDNEPQGYGGLNALHGFDSTSILSGGNSTCLGTLPNCNWVTNVLSWNGSGWNEIGPDWPVTSCQDIWGTAPNDFWCAAGSSMLRKTNQWEEVPTGTPAAIVALDGTASGDVWGVGSEGAIVHFDGNAWTPEATGVESDLWDVWIDPGGLEGWAVGLAIVLHWDGTGWNPEPTGVNTILRGVWAAGPGDVWAVGDYGVILRRQAGTWSPIDLGIDSTFTAVHGMGSQVWVIGRDDTVIRFDGADWSTMPSPGLADPAGVFVRGADDVWIADFGGIHHWDGQDWSQPSCSMSAAAIWAADLPHVFWALGGGGSTGGVVLLYDGVTCHDLHLSQVLADLWVGNVENAWAVGGGGTILRFTGSSWVEVPTGSDANLTAVWGTPSGEVWAVGYEGVILHRRP